ncbi:MAG TPA: hypothetical protein VGF86_04025 [Candidatus Tumulicola sp.]
MNIRLVWVAALLATSACASQAIPNTPAGPNSALADSAGGNSWASPDAKRHDLLYVSDFGSGSVSAYSYPELQPMATLHGLASPAGECSDRAGNVYITQPNVGRIREYAHGGTTPIAIFKSSPAPTACSVDPVSGNLAVANESSKAGPSEVTVYAAAQGKPAIYSAKGMYQHYAVAYDGAGDLFVDGVSRNLKFRLAELAKGAGGFEAVLADHQVRVPGNIQWDGTYLAVGDQSKGQLFRFAIAGGRATLAGTVALSDAWDPCQFWIAGATVIGPNFLGSNVSIWNYPDGGAPTKTISGLDKPFGVTISAR